MWQLPQKILIMYCKWMKKYFSFIHGTYFIPSLIPFHWISQWFMVDFSFSIQDWPGLFHSSVTGISFNISFLCGKLFIHSHPRLFHSIFHSGWQIFYSFISSLPWAISFNISFCMAGFSFIHFIPALGYFIPHGRFFIYSFHPCPGIFHSTRQVFHKCLSLKLSLEILIYYQIW